MKRTLIFWTLLILVNVVIVASAQPTPARKKNAPPPGAPVSAAEAATLEAVITTDLGVIRFEFFADKAPEHVSSFIRLARQGFYDGSGFHRVVPRGIIQGGDPLLKNARTPRTQWGTGGLNQLRDEFSDLKHGVGTVSTARIPNKANSGGFQFFICVSDQPTLDGQYSAFGLVTEGLDVVEQISLMPSDAQQMLTEPVKILSVKIEPKKEEPFKNATVDEMRKEVIIRTSLGYFTVAMDPETAQEHSRNFLKLVESGWYDRTAFHRIVPGFVIQGGFGSTRQGRKGHPADRWVHKLKPEFSQRPHIRGIISMARADDPNSADTSFFVVLAPSPFLDGKYSIFGKVVDGFDTLDKIAAVQRNGEMPLERVEIIEAVIKP
jgi:cyclophilin family peptidyl-prolyl cis-trans isomerase